MTVDSLPGLDWSKQDGLLPAIIQEAGTGRVLMLGYMNREALAATRASGRVTFFSRSRQRLWTKGETSGHFLQLVSIETDCDNDSLLVQAIAHGPTCHLQRASCFPSAPANFLVELDQLIATRERDRPEGSYTTKLFDSGLRRIAQKVGEEGVETAWRRWSKTTRRCLAKPRTWSITCLYYCGLADCRWPMPCGSWSNATAEHREIFLRAISFVLLAFVAGAASAAEPSCSGGSVFLDSNGNGTRDAGEAGLPGMRVSDGERIVVTDSGGAYRLATPSGRSTFLIKPAGYRVATRSDGLPDTWANVQTQAGPKLRYGGVPVGPATCRDFGLTRDDAKAAAPLSVLLIGDPQPKSLVDVDYYRARHHRALA